MNIDHAFLNCCDDGINQGGEPAARWPNVARVNI